MIVKNNYKKHWREFVSTVEVNINKLVSLVKDESQDKALLNAYSKHSLNKELNGHSIKGWHPLKKGLSLAQMNPLLFYTTIKDKASSVELMKWSREVVGLPVDRISSEEIFKKQIFYFDFEIPDSVLYTTNKDVTKLKSNLWKAVKKGMAATYIKTMYKNDSWSPFKITSTYRTEAEQAKAMVDYPLQVSDAKLGIDYFNRTTAMDLFSSFYHDGEQFEIKNETDSVKQALTDESREFLSLGGNQLIVFHSTVAGKKQYKLYKALDSDSKTQGETAFDNFVTSLSTSIKDNKAGAITFLTAWIKETNFKSSHQEEKAIDISNHIKKLTLIECAKKVDSSILAKTNYPGGNFHLYIK